MNKNNYRSETGLNFMEINIGCDENFLIKTMKSLKP